MLDEGVAITGAGGGKGRRSSGPREAPDDLLATSTARLIDVISEGPIGGWAIPEYPARCIYFDGVPLENPDGSRNFDGVEFWLRTGEPDQAPIPGFTEGEAEIPVGQVVTSQQPVSRTVTEATIDAVRVKVGLGQLTVLDTRTGNLNGGVVDYRIEMQVGAGGWTTVVTGRFAGKTTSGYQRGHRITLPEQRPVTLRVVRVTPDSASASVNDQIAFVSLTEIVEARLTYSGMAHVGLRFAADTFGGRIPERSYDVVGVGIQVPTNYDPATRTYDESSLWNGAMKTVFPHPEAGCNPAWFLFTLLGNDQWGLGDRIPPALRDKWSMYHVAKYCDEMVPDGRGGTERRYTIAGVFSTRQQAFDVVRRVAALFRSMVYWSAGAIVVAQDSPRDPVKLVANANVEGGRFLYSSTALGARHTVANVSFRDPDDRYRLKALISYEDPEAVDRYGRRVVDVAEPEVASWGQASRAAKWLVYTQTQETETVSYTAGLDHAGIRPGDRVVVSDRHRVGIRAAGRVKAVSGASVTLDAPFVFQAGQGHQIRLATRTGGFVTRAVAASQTGLRETVVLTQPPGADVQPGAVYVITATNLGLRQYTVVQNRRRGHLHDIVGVEHRPGKDAFIELGVAFDDAPPHLLPVNRRPAAPVGLSHVIWWRGAAEPEPWATLSCSPATGGVAVERWVARIRLATPVSDTVLVNAATIGGAPLQVGGVPVTIGGGYATDVRAQTEWRRLPARAQPSVDVRLWAGADANYEVQFRSVSVTGLESPWSEIYAFDPPALARPPRPTNLRIEPGLKSLTLYYTLPDIPNLRDVEIWGGTSPDPVNDIRLGFTQGSTFLLEGIGIGSTWYLRARTRAHQARNALSPWSQRVSGQARLMTGDELAEEIRNTIDDAREAALEALGAQNELSQRQSEVEALVGNLGQETLGQLQDIVDALGGIATGDIEELRGLRVAGRRRGWAIDPTFDAWTGGGLDHWATAGLVTYGTRIPANATPPARYLSGVSVDLPAAAGAMTMSAGSHDGNLLGADPAAEYVVVAALLRCLSGGLGGAYLRAQWRRASDGAWINGRAFGAEQSAGALAGDWGLRVDPAILQSAERTWRRPPGGSYDAVRVALILRDGVSTEARVIRVEYLDLIEAAEPDIAAYNQGAAISAAIEAFGVTITGPGGALAAQKDTITAEWGAAFGQVSSAQAAFATDLAAIGGRVDVTEARIGGGNLVRNPAFRIDNAALAGGVAPALWDQWPAQMSVVARDPGASEAPRQTAPAQWIARIAGGGVFGARAVRGHVVRPGAVLRAEIDAARIGADRTLRVQARWFDASGAEMVQQRTNRAGVPGAAWSRMVFEPFNPPSGTATVDFHVFGLEAPGPLFLTNVDIRERDAAALARISTVEGAQVDLEQAVAAFEQTVSAQLGAVSAQASIAATSVATLEGLAASSVVIRAVAGPGGSSQLALTAWDDPTGAGGLLKVRGDAVVEDGTLLARHVVVGDADNIVRDDQLADPLGWVLPAGFDIVPEPSGAMRSVNSIRYTHSGGTTYTPAVQPVLFNRFKVSPGEPYHVAVQTVRASGTQYRVRARVFWYDRDQQFIGPSSVVGNALRTTAGVHEMTATLVSPPAAQFAALTIDVQRADTNGNVRIGGLLARKRQQAATMIRPESVFSPEFIGDKATLGTLLAIEAYVSTLNVAGNAITFPAGAAITGARQNLSSATRNHWHRLLSATLPRTGAPLLVSWGLTLFKTSNLASAAYRYALYRTPAATALPATTSGTNPPGTMIQNVEYFVADASDHCIGRGDVDTAGSSGSFTYSIWLRHPSAPNSSLSDPWTWRSLAEWIQFIEAKR